MSSVREQLEALLVRGGVPHLSASKFAAMSRSAVRLSASVSADGDLPVGTSKLGGTPDWPEGSKWPSWKEAPLSFVAQIDLATLRDCPSCEVLPPSGLLSFFFDSGQQAWGFDPQHHGGWLVQFQADTTGLRRMAVPAGMPEGGVFRACALSVREAHTLPAPDSRTVIDQRLTTKELDLYSQVASARAECHQA